MKVEADFKQVIANEEQWERLLLVIGQIPVFSRLTKDEQESILRTGKAVHYDPREVVFEQDSATDDLHVVLGGTVLLVRIVKDKGARVLAEKGEGTSFGEISFLSKAKRSLQAVVGDKESMQLLFARSEFEQLLATEPQIGFKIYQGIVDGVYERLEQLPLYFRNFVMWGYQPTEDRALDSGQVVIGKSKLFPIAGAVGGAVGAFALQAVLAGINDAVALREGSFPAVLGTLALLFGGIGLGVGYYYDDVEENVNRYRKSQRSCMNCQFVLWDESSAKFGCFYSAEKMTHVMVKPGQTYDSWTDCPSFNPSAKVMKAQQAVRDAIGKG